MQQIRAKLKVLEKWFEGHRVLAISVLNSAGIFLLASLLGALILRSPDAEATGMGYSGGPLEAAHREAPTRNGRKEAAARSGARAPAALLPPKVGSRDYEVKLRGRAPPMPLPASSAQQLAPAQPDSIKEQDIERSAAAETEESADNLE